MNDFEMFKKNLREICELVSRAGIKLSTPTDGDSSMHPEVRAFYAGGLDGVAGSLVNLNHFALSLSNRTQTSPVFSKDTNDNVFDF
jgi:hypothetical protein